jgi:nucleotide-binding universal stress UspA family protein
MRILLPVDGSAFSKRVLGYLGDHARMFRGAVAYTLVHVQTPIPLRARAIIDEEHLEAMHATETERATRTTLAFLKRKGWNWRLVTRRGVPGDEIARLAERGRFDLIVMGSHGHGALGALLLGSTSQRVMARCRVPVLLVR